MNELNERAGLADRIVDAARGLPNKLKRILGGDKQPNPADIAAAETALGMSAPEAASTLNQLFPDKFANQAAAEKAVAGIGAGINRDNRAAAATERKMDEVSGLLDQMMGAGQTQKDQDVDDIVAQMDAMAQQKGQKTQ